MSLNENELQQYLGGAPKELIKEFPRVLAKPPEDPFKFTYCERRNRIIS